MRVVGLLLCVLLLLFTSLVSAGFFTEKSKDKDKDKDKDADDDDVTVREEGSGVVIEVDGNAKVSVLPHDHGDQQGTKVYEERVNEAIGKAKDTVTRTVNTASDKAQEMKENAKDAAAQVSSKAKEQAQRAKQQTYDAIIGNNNNKDTVLKDVAKDIINNKQGGPRDVIRRIFRFMVSPVRMSSSSSSLAMAAGVLHLLGFAVAYGTSAWVTFASNYVLGKALAGQQLAMVQSKIYPLYYKAMGYSIGMALLGYLVGGQWGKPGMLQAFNLMASLVMILLNLLYLEPRTTQVIFERMKKEKEEGTGKEEGYSSGVDPAAGTETAESAAAAEVTTTGAKASEAAAKPQTTGRSRILLGRLWRSGVLNSYSSLLNGLTLVSLTWHLLHLGQHLHAVC